MLTYSIESQGKSIILRCSDSRELTTSDYPEALSFLLQPTDMALVYNVDAFVDLLTNLMPKPLKNKILKGGRVYTPDNRKIYYQTSRVLGVNQIDFFPLQRYTEEKIDNPQELLKLGEEVLKAFESFGIYAPKRLTSPVAVYAERLESIPYARACDLPGSAFPMLEMCYPIQSREWREVFKLGHWEADKITDVDLGAAYPSIMAGLPDLSRAKFFPSDTLPENYTWGVLEGKLTITAPVSPFKGIGTWTEVITSDMLRLIDKWHLGSFELEHGEFFLLPKPAIFPFKETMEQLYQARESDNPMVTRIAKAISVGIGGKLAERYSDGSLGDNANPIYALMTTSRCMVKVADFIYRNALESDLVTVLVDGFMATKQLPLENKKAMGSFRVNDPLPALVLSVEYQWQGNKHPAYVTHDELVKMIKEHPNRRQYQDVDINIVSYSRLFRKKPKIGKDLFLNKYDSEPYEFQD